MDSLGYIGKYARAYRPGYGNFHRLANDFFGLPSRAAFPPGAAVVQIKKIPDVSFYQGDINFSQMRQMTDALIIRAGQNTWVDSQFKDNWQLAKQHGILRSSYWFYDDRKSPGLQAETWAELLHQDLPEMEIWVDWENSYGGSFGGIKNVVAMMEAMERFLPTVEIGMYTGYWWFREHTNAVTNAGQYEYLKRHKLFEAWYTDNAAQVLIPNPWTSLHLWQFGTPAVGRDYGVETAEIDMSFINMTEAEFQQKYRGVVAPPPPATGETTMSQWYRANASAGLNIRDGAGAGNRDIGDLYPGDMIEVEGTPVNGWGHIVRLLRVGNTVPIAFDGWCSLAYCVAIAPPIVTPPPTEPPAPTFPPEIGVTIGGVTKPYVLKV